MASVDQEVAPTTETCDVELCSAWHLVPHIISVTVVSRFSGKSP